MEIKDDAVTFELEYVFHVETINHSLQMDVELAFLALGLELTGPHEVIKSSNVLTQVPLENLLSEGCILAG